MSAREVLIILAHDCVTLGSLLKEPDGLEVAPLQTRKSAANRLGRRVTTDALLKPLAGRDYCTTTTRCVFAYLSQGPQGPRESPMEPRDDLARPRAGHIHSIIEIPKGSPISIIRTQALSCWTRFATLRYPGDYGISLYETATRWTFY
jgi:hypothetical protein